MESYSRTLESLAFAVLSRIEDVLHADAVAGDPKRTKSRRMTSSLESPVLEAAAAEAEAEREEQHQNTVHWQDQELEDGERPPEAPTPEAAVSGAKLKKVHRISTRKFLHTQRLDSMTSGLKSFSHR